MNLEIICSSLLECNNQEIRNNLINNTLEDIEKNINNDEIDNNKLLLYQEF